MAFIGILLMMGILNAAFWALMISIMIGLVVNIIEGGLMAGMGKYLSRNEILKAKHGKLLAGCGGLGWVSVAVGFAAILISIIFLAVPQTMYVTEADGSFKFSGLVIVFCGLIILAAVLFQVLGVFFFRIAGLNKKLDSPQVPKWLMIVCRILGILILVFDIVIIFIMAGVLLLH